MINTVTPVPKGIGVLLKAPLSGHILPIEQVSTRYLLKKWLGMGFLLTP